jgi:2-methylcitrate dehydratase PrpD
MAATFGLKQIMDDGLAATDVTAIDVFVPPPQVKMVDHGVNAGDRASHLTSVPYQMAVAAITPDAAYDVAQSPSVLSDDVRAFMQKIKVAPDERLLSDYPRLWRARLSVTSTRGEREREVSDVPGDPALAFDADGIKHKFHRFVGPILGADAAERLLQSSLSALDQQQSRQTLTHQLAAHY